jgi:hypothetical protein
MVVNERETTEHTPFLDLPAALVEELLAESGQVAERLSTTFRALRDERPHLRQVLEQDGLLVRESDLGYPPLPTTCGVDGSYAIERLLSVDLAACAAVAVEGLTPPSEQRYWEQPRHRLFVRSEVHDVDTATMLRAVMVGYELLLAVRAPHDIVLLDGTLTLPVIYLNQALSKAADSPALQTSTEFLDHLLAFLDAYHEVLQPSRSDRCFVGLPKYTTRREVGRRLGWPEHQDDRGLLTLLLQAGELTRPLPLEQPRQEWHLTVGTLGTSTRAAVEERARRISAALREICVVYYKPHQWLPVLRIELPAAVAESPDRLAMVIQALRYQSATPGMFEPYPLYLADRTVKALARAVPAFRQVATQHIAQHYEGDVAEVYLGMHGYRSESGA